MNYYNENDKFAAAWLRELIKAGLISEGVVDERSIEDVVPTELAGFTQCHFFAGIGGWSYALRLAGWPDDRPAWTGSCPCQPFSTAGKGAGFTDERHLWPAFYHLISQCRPDTVYGEQVASSDSLPWLDLVHTDMEAAQYAFAAADMCAAGFGAPHIRQRLYWVADSNADRRATLPSARSRDTEHHTEPRGESSRLDHHHHEGLEGQRGGHHAEGERQAAVRPIAPTGESGGVADTEHDGGRAVEPQWQAQGRVTDGRDIAGVWGARPTGPTNGFWSAADWLYCRDGKWRPVEPGAFPLAHGVRNRVGKLRGYGNAIIPQEAAAWIKANQG